MKLAVTNPLLLRRAATACRQAQIKPIRSMRRWAEEELVIPNGPKEGDPFLVENQPVLGLLLDEFDSGRWVEHYTTGPSQSAKTFGCFVIPIAYHLSERGEDVVCGVPDMNMAADKWADDLLPAFQASPSLRKQLPTRGSGSDGGKITDSVELNNSAKLKLMSRGSKDQGKAGFTARIVSVTELAGFSVSVESSVEAGPLDQLEARQKSWDYPERRTYAEGTLTVAEQLPWSARADSSCSRIVSPCPNCGAWVQPQRQHLIGWQDAENIIQAEEQAHWICPVCTDPIDDDQRRESVQDCAILHGEQTIDRRGRVKGELPPTRRLWFHWQSWHNLFVSTASVARDEWLASRMAEESDEREKAERKLCQFVHGVCFTPSNVDSLELDPKAIASRRSSSPRGVLPSDTEHFTIGVDLGKYLGWWIGLAFRPNGKIRVFDFGSFDICSDQLPIAQAIVKGLQDLHEMTEAGWAVHGKSDVRKPDKVWIDAGYQGEAVHHWVKSLGKVTAKGRYMPIIGRGTGQMQSSYLAPAKRSSRILMIGDNWHLNKVPKYRSFEVHVNADHYKEVVQESVSLHRDLPGAMDFFVASERDLSTIARHFTNEKKTIEFKPGKGRVVKWLRLGQQHWLDSAGYARAAASSLGWKVPIITEGV